MNSKKWMPLCVLGISSFLVLAAFPQQHEHQKPPQAAKPNTAASAPVDQSAEMQAAMPGPAHKRLAKLAGEYTTASKFWMQPGAQPSESDGTAKLSTLLGGRFLAEENSGVLLGQPYSGMRLWGYDNATKQYEAVWTYTGSTQILVLTGTSPNEGKSVHYKASIDHPNGVKQPVHILTREVDDDHFVVTLEGIAGPLLETTYTRKK